MFHVQRLITFYKTEESPNNFEKIPTTMHNKRSGEVRL